MFTKKIRKIIYIFCEGPSERNYFKALKGNKFVSCNYTLKFPPKDTNDLENAIKKSQRLEGIDIIIIYIYDSDVFKKEKSITKEIKNKKEFIYFNEEDFEDFLECHKARPIYKDKKPNLSRQIIEEIRNLDYNFIKKSIKKPKKFKNFKSVYELLEELFKEKL